jgi:hypothetical protein
VTEFWRIAVVLLVLAGGKVFAAPDTAITADEIVRRMVAKADSATNGSPRAHYVYFKRSTTEKLNGKGNVEERKEKLIQITGGKGSVVQIKVNGKPLSSDELKKAEAEVQAEDQKMNDSRVARRSDNFERLLTGDLVSRYQFTLLRQEPLNGRTAYVLSFRPGNGELPVREISDRFINNLKGLIWVDTEEYEIARADLSLQSEVTLWGGVLGALRKFDYKVERVRMDDGVWFNRSSRGEFVGRKFLDNMSVRTHSECTNFEKIPVKQARNR